MKNLFICAFISFCLILAFSTISMAQCTDSDSDGYYYENGCGTLMDCNDADASIHPGAAEACNGYDDNCDGSIDETCTTSCGNPGVYGSNVRITNYLYNSENPRMVWMGSQYGIAWTDERTVPEGIFFADVDRYGNKIDIGDSSIAQGSYANHDPAMVWTGEYFAIAWTYDKGTNSEIFVNPFVDKSGAVKGGTAQITNDPASSLHPSIAWNGNGFGVSWEEYRDGNSEIYFARLARNGPKIGSDVRLTNNSASSEYPSIVWNGNEYAVAWQDYRDKKLNNVEIYFARIDSSGNKIGSDVRVTSDVAISQYPSLIWTGSEYGVAWSDNRNGNYEIYFARLDSSGIKIGSDTRITNNASISAYPSISWTGTEYGISWDDTRDGNTEIYFARLDWSGTKIGSDIRVTSNSATSEHASLTWSGHEFAVAWQDARDGNLEIYTSQIHCCDNDADMDTFNACNDCDDADSSIYPGAPQICGDNKNNDCDHPNWPSLQGTNEYDNDGDGFTECQGDCDDSSSSIYPGAREQCNSLDDDCDGSIDESFDQDGDGHYSLDSCQEPHDDCNDADPSVHPGMTEICNGLDDDCDGSLDEGCNQQCNQSAKEGSDMRITYDPQSSEDISFVWTGSGYGIAWLDSRDGNNEIYFARLDSSGNKVGSDVRVTYDPAYSESPSLAWTGSEYAIAWRDYRDGNYEIYFTRLDPQGNKIGQDRRISFNGFNSVDPSLVWNGSEYGLAYVNRWNVSGWVKGDVRFVTLDRGGNTIGGEKIYSQGDGLYSSSTGSPFLKWTGNEYGLAWGEGAFTLSEYEAFWEISFIRLDNLGNALQSDRRITYHKGAYNPSLDWNGTEYVLAFDSESQGGVVYLQMIDSSGNEIGPEKILTDVTYSKGTSPIRWNGLELGICWSVTSGAPNTEIYFIRADDQGNKLGSDTRLTFDPASSSGPFLNWTGDGYGVAWVDARDGNKEIYFAPINCCDAGIDNDSDGHSQCDDCNDNDASIYPGAPELCDGKDNDCDGSVDEGLSTDADGDGHYTLDSCYAPHDDCDDNNSSTYPGAGEITCNGVDNNCDGPGNEYFDNDLDGYDICGSEDAINPDGLEKDCNDDNPSIHPGVAEMCNGLDDNCDSSLDEGCDTSCGAPAKYGSDKQLTFGGFDKRSSLVWQGEEFGLVFEPAYFMRLSHLGNSIGDIKTVTSWMYPSLTWSGSNYGVAWEGYGLSEVYFTRVDPEGNRIGADIRVSFDSEFSRIPDIAWTGSEYGITWWTTPDPNLNYSPQSEIYFARLDSSGNTIGSQVRVTNNVTADWDPSIVWADTGYGIAWAQLGGNWTVYFARLDSSGRKIGSDIKVSSSYYPSLYVSLVWTGSEYGISWSDLRDGNWDIYFARFDSSGNKIGSDMRISSGSNSIYSSLVWTGSEFGVAWEDDRDYADHPEIYFARLDSSGNVLGSELRVTFTGDVSERPSLVWTGSEYGISWQERQLIAPYNTNIYFALIKCCEDDRDADDWNACNDCDDLDSSVYPGATELCDLKDNNCDGTIDEGFSVPIGTEGLNFEISKQAMNWNGVSQADRYDVVKGDLMVLRSSLGDFTSSLLGCLENDSLDTHSEDFLEPAPGQGFYYLARAQNCQGNGTYNTGAASQIGDRDAEIEASSTRCP